VFSEAEASAMVAYLCFIRDSGRLAGNEINSINEALTHYWLAEAGEIG